MTAITTSLLGWLASAQVFAATQPEIRTSMMAESPVSDYTAAVIIQVIWIGFLITALLGGAFVVLNMGLMSKRKDDRVGGRFPGDVSVLRETIWPLEDPSYPTLPADDDDDGKEHAA